MVPIALRSRLSCISCSLLLLTILTTLGCNPIESQTQAVGDEIRREVPKELQEDAELQSPETATDKPQYEAAETSVEVATEAQPASRSKATSGSTDDNNIQDVNTFTTSTGQETTVDLTTAYKHLVEGEFFHTIPETLTRNKSLIIEAGVAKQVTQELLSSLNIDGPVSVEQGALYDPLGVELQLTGIPSGDFKIETISGGQKAILNESPDQWKWNVIPLRTGSATLKLEAIITLDTPANEPQQEKRMVTQTEIPIKTNLERILPIEPEPYLRTILVLGSLTISGFLAWSISKKYYQQKFPILNTKVSSDGKNAS